MLATADKPTLVNVEILECATPLCGSGVSGITGHRSASKHLLDNSLYIFSNFDGGRGYPVCGIYILDLSCHLHFTRNGTKRTADVEGAMAVAFLFFRDGCF